MPAPPPSVDDAAVARPRSLSTREPQPTTTPISISTLSFRPLQPSDLDEVRAAHRDLFPLDYDDDFFVKATSGADRIFSYAAFQEEQDDDDDDHDDDGQSSPSHRPARARRRPSCSSSSSASSVKGPEEDNDRRSRSRRHHKQRLVAFATARLVRLHECEPPDRRALGLAAPVFDADVAAYILTLGVIPGPWRRAGVAGALVRMCCAHAAAVRCRAAFLHVAAYNGAALALYSSLGFTPLVRLPGFYTIATGRQPDRDVTSYDALLYALQPLRGGEDAARLAGEVRALGCVVSSTVPPSPFCQAEEELPLASPRPQRASAWWWWAGWQQQQQQQGRRGIVSLLFPPVVAAAPAKQAPIAADGPTVLPSCVIQEEEQQQQHVTPPNPASPPSRTPRERAPPPPEPLRHHHSGGGGLLRWLFGGRARHPAGY
jgi:ribosomal protein S18 acetylase RimI-like enzyme